MSPIGSFTRIFDSLLDRILCVAGAVLFSQAPEFMQQYLQRLGGHLEEARRHLGSFQQTAKQSGLTLEHFIVQTASNPDPAVAKLAGVMTGSAERVTNLQAAHDALIASAAWERPLVFLRNLDPEIARSTAAIYQPAVPTTMEGLTYAVLGMLAILAVYHVIVKSLLRLALRRRNQTSAAAA